MNDEIKLMLNIIKDVSEHKEGSRNGLMILSCKDYKQLLDYITNLQQELEEEKRIEEADLKTIQRLEEENERLFKEKLDIQKDLTNRIYKAIEYINNYCIDDEFYINLSNKEKAIIKVLNILQNGSDSQ